MELTFFTLLHQIQLETDKIFNVPACVPQRDHGDHIDERLTTLSVVDVDELAFLVLLYVFFKLVDDIVVCESSDSATLDDSIRGC
jgi:hypothetical protein